MIYRLQRKFILICTASVLTVVFLVFGVILALNISSMNRNIDILADRVSEGGGRFPKNFNESFKPHKRPVKAEGDFDFITPETPFATRHFTVLFDNEGNVTQTNTEAIYSITDDTAVEYAKKVIKNSDERGWLSNYRYKVFSLESGTGVVFIYGSMSRSAFTQSTMIAGVVLLVCATLVLLMIILLSKRVVKPIAESYEKQRQFITDANHELKTPLTLILANAEIAQEELGKNEWLDDITAEGQRMTELVNQLVALSRMDEENSKLNIVQIPFGELVFDTVSEFEALARGRGKALSVNIDRSIIYSGDETLLHRLVGILLDNAVKYCDEGGEIKVNLEKRRRIILSVENTYAAVGEIELNKLFDRFYRADKARKFTGGYGVGLSMAKAIAEKHKGEITAYKKDKTTIGFKVIL